MPNRRPARRGEARRVLRLAILASLLLAAPGRLTATGALDPPAAAGTDADPWIEGAPPQQLARFLHAQDDHARAVLARLPQRERLLSAISALDGARTEVSMPTTLDGRRFYLWLEAGMQAARLETQDPRAPDAPGAVLLDPADPGGATGQDGIDQLAPSQDAALLAYGISGGGSQTGVLHVLETATRRIRRDAIDRARLGRFAWAPDGRSFFYVRQPRSDAQAPADAAGAPLRVYRHRLGEDPRRDRLILDPDRLAASFGEIRAGAAPIVPALLVPPGSDYVLAELGDAASPEFALYAAPYASLERPAVPWKRVAARSDGVVAAAVRGTRIDLLTHQDAPHFKIVETDLDRPSFAGARLRVGAGSGVLTGLDLAADGLYLARRDGTTTTLLRLADGAAVPEIITLPVSGSIDAAGEAAGGLLADPRRTGVDVVVQSRIHPLAWLHYDPASRAVADLGIVPGLAHDLRAYQSVETSVRGRDGTPIPLSILGRRDRRRDGPRPTLLEASRAFGVPDDPAFMPALLPWLDGGGVYAVAHLRGGAGGSAADDVADFVACARALITRHLTDAAHLAAGGTGAGGILIGDAIARAPELFRAALMRIGATDALRERPSAADPGAGGITDRARFPAVLLTGYASDPRLPLREPAKMLARLQRASRSGRPVLLRISPAGGRGLGAMRVRRDADAADEQAFLLWQMGEPDDQPPTP